MLAEAGAATGETAGNVILKKAPVMM